MIMKNDNKGNDNNFSHIDNLGKKIVSHKTQKFSSVIYISLVFTENINIIQFL